MINEIEIWLPIKGFEEGYEISNMGRVKSIARTIAHPLGFKRKKERILKPLIDRKGYEFVILCRETHREHKWIARLAALHFIPNPENKPTVNHKYGVKRDNRVTQLEWATFTEQAIHSYETGLQKRLFNKEDILFIRDQKMKGVPVVDIAKNFKARYETVLHASSKESYKNILTWQS